MKSYFVEDTVWNQSMDIENIDPTQKPSRPITPGNSRENTFNNHYPVTKSSVQMRKSSASGMIPGQHCFNIDLVGSMFTALQTRRDLLFCIFVCLSFITDI